MKRLLPKWITRDYAREIRDHTALRLTELELENKKDHIIKRNKKVNQALHDFALDRLERMMKVGRNEITSFDRERE